LSANFSLYCIVLYIVYPPTGSTAASGRWAPRLRPSWGMAAFTFTRDCNPGIPTLGIPAVFANHESWDWRRLKFPDFGITKISWNCTF